MYITEGSGRICQRSVFAIAGCALLSLSSFAMYSFNVLWYSLSLSIFVIALSDGRVCQFDCYGRKSKRGWSIFKFYDIPSYDVGLNSWKIFDFTVDGLLYLKVNVGEEASLPLSAHACRQFKNNLMPWWMLVGLTCSLYAFFCEYFRPSLIYYTS